MGLTRGPGPLPSRRALVGLGLTAALPGVLACDPPRPAELPPRPAAPPPKVPLPDPTTELGARLEALLGVPMYGPRAREAGRYLAFAAPGIPFTKDELGPTARPGDAASFRAAARLARLLDPVPLPAARWSTTGATVSNAYETAVRFAQVAADTEPTEAERRRMDEARAKIAALEETYTRHQQRYEAARVAHAAAELAKRDPKSGEEAVRRERDRRAELEAAAAEWSAVGGREAYLDASAIVAQIAGRAPVLLLRRLREELEIAARTDPEGHRYLHTSLCPADPTGDDALWTSFHAEGDADLPAGVTIAPGIVLPVERVSGELLSAVVVRPWMDPQLFRYRFWRFPPGFERLSDDGDPPRGALVAYVSSVVLSRGLRVEITRGGLAPGKRVDMCAVGPLSVSGAAAGEDGRSLCAPGVQIVALVCELLPASPDPDPKIAF